MKPRMVMHTLRDTSGASIVIALVFFLICGIIGSVVLTAASVEAKAVATQRELQQAEFTVGSAAQVVGAGMQDVVLSYDDAAKEVKVTEGDGSLGAAFWNSLGSTIMKASRVTPIKFMGVVSMKGDGASSSIEPVYETVEVDEHLNISITLSLDEHLDKGSKYNMRVDLQCIPTYDVKGNLKSFTYEEPVVQVASNAMRAA